MNDNDGLVQMIFLFTWVVFSSSGDVYLIQSWEIRSGFDP